jgi:hypothetical protein
VREREYVYSSAFVLFDCVCLTRCRRVLMDDSNVPDLLSLSYLVIHLFFAHLKYVLLFMLSRFPLHLTPHLLVLSGLSPNTTCE